MGPFLIHPPRMSNRWKQGAYKPLYRLFCYYENQNFSIKLCYLTERKRLIGLLSLI